MTLLIGLQGICPKNLKHIQLSDIMLQLKATSFASFSSLNQLQYPPSFLDSCESPIGSGRSSQIFRMISFKEPKISSNITSKIIEFRQITRVLNILCSQSRASPILAPRRNSLMIPKRYDKFGTVKILTVSRKQWYKNFENPSKFIFIVHPLPLSVIIITKITFSFTLKLILA